MGFKVSDIQEYYEEYSKIYVSEEECLEISRSLNCGRPTIVHSEVNSNHRHFIYVVPTSITHKPNKKCIFNLLRSNELLEALSFMGQDINKALQLSKSLEEASSVLDSISFTGKYLVLDIFISRSETSVETFVYDSLQECFFEMTPTLNSEIKQDVDIWFE